mgnify:CR=1 FL=1|tara:strand:+ start:25003 stop:29739 length:4737 start_codon:yes stop_codon:yes gene_type:complete
MAEKLLDKASYSVVRTNPKLTANVKVVSDGTDIYLESFSANTALSGQRYKAFKVDGSNTYDRDVFRFFNSGKFPLESAYEVFQEYEDTAVLSEYGNQYEMFYGAGTRSVASESYPQSLGTLAPLWLNEQIPNYFVIFRLDNPAAVNNVIAANENSGSTDAQTSARFNKNVLENCTAIKTFDLTEGTALGSYIRNYRNQEEFPEVPLNISWRKDQPILWNGISYKNGGFTSGGAYAYSDLITKDATILQDEFIFTQGFQNNGILLANLLNLEFLFDDHNAPDYSINRYFGMYVNEVEEGNFDLSGIGFFKNTEKSQLPDIKTITEVSQFLNTSFEMTNEEGILLFLDPNKTTTVTGVPTPTRVNEVESVFYVKDKEDDFHTIKKGSLWNNNQIRLFDKKIDISLLTGYKQPDTFANASIIKHEGYAQMYLEITNNIQDGANISFYDGSDLTGTIFANESLVTVPGTSFQNFFNPNGTLQEVAQAITSAINKGINENDRFFTASYNDSTVYIKSRFSGSRFNQLNFKIDIAYPEVFNDIISYPITSVAEPQKSFVGGNDVSNSLLKVELGDQDRFIKGNFVQTTGGFATIGDWVPYTEEPIYNPANPNEIIGYTDINKYVIITCNDDQIMVTRSNQVALYSDYKPSFGRFSFFDVRDFDVDFYSNLYSEEGELAFETSHYNETVVGSANPIIYTGISSNPEVREFYDNGGFFNLIGLLKDSDPESDTQGYIKSEYIRLEENFLTSQASASRIIPYINKWSWVNDGKDVRNHPYRLDLSEAFGINNFAPSKWDRGQVASGYTHEWYYLCEFPKYFKKNAIASSWSYIDTAPTDNLITPNLITGIPDVTLGTFQRVDKDYFNDYFIVQRFNNATNGIVEIDRQLRYGRFNGGNSNNFAESFLRGVRIIAKPKAIGTEKPDFNARSLSYVQDGSFNDYRFSAMLVPNLPNKPETEIKFIKNDKWKTVVMLISVSFNEPCITGSVINPESIIDRTSLYSAESKYVVDSQCAPVGAPSGPYTYLDGIMQGAINFSSSTFDSTNQTFIIQGVPDVNDIPTRFFDDITVGLNGEYASIRFIVSGNTYIISGITQINSQNELVATSVTQNGLPWPIPNFIPNSLDSRSATYQTLGGGYNAYTNRLSNIGFAEIFDAVNQGNPNVIYETISNDGKLMLNSDGTLAQTFGIELRAQADILKSVYVGVLPDPAKPTAFNLTDVIGYDLSLQRKPRITPIARHAGYYQPTALSILSFRDPYENIDFSSSFTGSTGATGSSNISDEVYKLKVLELCKWCNTQFNSSDINFGQLQNFFYHKVNEQDPSTVLELSADSAFQSLYPLINEIGIDYKDFYAFSSNWEPSYFIKSIDKTLIEDVIGTRSMKEKKSFFGSKYLKVPEEIILETFIPDPLFKGAIKQPSLINGTFMHQDISSVIINKPVINTNGVLNTRSIKKKPSPPVINFFLLIEKRLKEFLFTPIKAEFIKYINPLYGWGDLETLDDDVNRYIEENILKLYKIGKVDFYTLASRTNTPSDFTTAELTNAEKITAGLRINENVSSKTLNTNPFDLRLIYNKRTGFSESFGFSVTIVKK